MSGFRDHKVREKKRESMKSIKSNRGAEPGEKAAGQAAEASFHVLVGVANDVGAVDDAPDDVGNACWGPD